MARTSHGRPPEDGQLDRRHLQRETKRELDEAVRAVERDRDAGTCSCEHEHHVVAAACSSPYRWVRRRASASRAWDLTAPTDMSSAATVSASVRSSK